MLDFPLILIFLMIASGLIWLLDHFYFAHKRTPEPGQSTATMPVIADYAKSLFPVFLLVFLLRSFVAQLFYVPTGSLAPTVKPGELLLVTQYSYGLRMPVWNHLLLSTWLPQRGDIAVFRWPVNPRADFVKRVIGLPGDSISYINKVFYINGKEAKQTLIKTTDYNDPGNPGWPVKELWENLDGVKHKIYVCPASSTTCPGHAAENFYNLHIPKGYYFMVGDNRDDSDDSRFWGLVPEKFLVGKARRVLFSWNVDKPWSERVRWSRFGTGL